jgi:hypothetical protein
VDGDLIGAYVVALRQRLSWRSDLDDVVDEVEDHLREQCDRLVSRGADPADAQQETLRRFGELGIVAGSFSEAATGAPALPTRGTRAAGFAGAAAALFWLASILTAGLGGFTDTLHPWTVERYWIWAPCTVLAVALTLWTMAGALVRVGHLHTRSGVTAVAVTALVTLFLVPMTWAVLPAMVAAALVALLALRGHLGEAHRTIRPLRLLAVWPGAVALQAFLEHAVRLGPLDEYGDRPVARFAAFVLAALVTAAATGTVGRSLAREHPADLRDPQPTSPALAG